MAGEEHGAGGQAQLQIRGRGLPQLSGPRGEVQDVVHQLQGDKQSCDQSAPEVQVGHAPSRRADYLKGDADVLSVLEGYFVHFGVRVHQDGDLG